MRKAIFTATLATLAGLLGLTGQALAASDPGCDQYGNAFGLYEVSLDTPDTHGQHLVSGVSGAGLACGTDIEAGSGYSGWETLIDNIDIAYPDGVKVNSTESMEVGAHVGSATVNAAMWLTPSLAGVVENLPPLGVNVEDMAACEAENQNTAGGPQPGEIVACYKGIMYYSFIPFGHGWIWVTDTDGSGNDSGLVLTIGPWYNDLILEPAGLTRIKDFYDTTTLDEPAGLTRIKDFSLCAYAGYASSPMGSYSCGSSSRPWVQKNGDALWGNCLRGGANPNGVYTMTATNKAGQTTAPVSVCVSWLGPHKAAGGASIPR